jgi:predicted DNA-binding transcriptional regulator YafY
MKQLDRLFGILLALRGGQPVAAAELARRFEVSPRTIYRDVETLSALGVPVFARQGYGGGLQLLEGYYLPPLMLTQGEAVSLLLGLAMLGSLQAKPFGSELEAAERKLLAAVPEGLRATLSQAAALVGFETPPADSFHPEPGTDTDHAPDAAAVGRVVSAYLQAILDRREVVLDYQSPYQPEPLTVTLRPAGAFWDRERWYLAGWRTGRRPARTEAPRLFRADRVRGLRAGGNLGSEETTTDFDVRDLLGRRWMQTAMAQWRKEAPVRLRVTRAQAERLQQDWYYRHAAFTLAPDEMLTMEYGDDDAARVLALVRWLGPGAELLEPAAWREAARAELEEMLEGYK